MANGTCRVADEDDPCAGQVTKHDLCARHFHRQRRTGFPTWRELVLSRLPAGAVGECWLWGGRLNRDGYGVTHARGSSSALAHRLAYELLVDAIPDGMTIDHMCHRAEKCEGGKTCPHRRCCNPAHLKVAARGPNALRGNSPSGANSRKEFCNSGHEYTEANTYWCRGKRQCKQCRRRNDRERVRKSGSGWERQRKRRSNAGQLERSATTGARIETLCWES